MMRQLRVPAVCTSLNLKKHILKGLDYSLFWTIVGRSPETIRYCLKRSISIWRSFSLQSLRIIFH